MPPALGAISTPQNVPAGGMNLAVSWSDVSEPFVANAIALHRTSSPSGELTRKAIPGAASGSVDIWLTPDYVGTVEARLYQAHEALASATSNSFTVAHTPPFVAISLIEYLADDLEVTPEGLPLTVEWSGGSGLLILTDRVELYRLSPPAGVVASTRLTSLAGTHTFTLTPAMAGVLEARFYIYGATTPTARSTQILVTAPAPSLGAIPSVVHTGAAGVELPVTWSGIASPTAQDALALVRLDPPASQPARWRYLDGAASGTVVFFIGPEDVADACEFRLYQPSLTGFPPEPVAVSNTFAVEAP
jgi:hypothetical protein